MFHKWDKAFGLSVQHGYGLSVHNMLIKYFKPPVETYYSERKKKRKEKLIFQIQLLIDIQAEFRNGRGTRDQIANIHWIIEKAREFQKNIYSCFIDYQNF